jgi:hypothetical protein
MACKRPGVQIPSAPPPIDTRLNRSFRPLTRLRRDGCLFRWAHFPAISRHFTGVLAAWAAAALLTGGLLLRLRDA